MPAPTNPLQSQFSDTVADDSTTLFKGADESATTLTVELSNSETEFMYVTSTTGAPNRGYAIIGDEIIRYEGRFGAQQIRYLTRGVNGTTAAIHTVSTPVSLIPDYYIPAAWQDSVLAMQELIISQKALIDDLSDRVTMLETP